MKKSFTWLRRAPLLAAPAAVWAVLSVGCGDGGANTSNGGAETITDSRDGKTYKTVKIGNQRWMAENLNYEPSSEPSSDNSWCYGNSVDSCNKYGRMYSWSAAMAGAKSSNASPSGVRGVCPGGWHLPSNAEWDTLVNYAGGLSVAGKKLMSKTGWKHYSESYYGTDDYGFSALPGGGRFSHGDFVNAGDGARWWTATETETAVAYHRAMGQSDGDSVGLYARDKGRAFSIRCVLD